MSLIIPANTLASGGYEVANSLRFNGTNDSLVRTPSSAGSSTINTWSFWVKRSELDSSQTLYSSEVSSSNVFKIGFTSNTLEILFYVAPAYRFQIKTNRLFRDVSAWYNIVIIQNAGASTNTDRLQIWVNGVRETSFSITNFPDADEGAAPINASSVSQNIGTTGTENFGGYMSEVVHIDGTAYAASDFGEFDEDSGIWKPIDVSGLTFGTNGSYFQFKETGTSQNSSGMGADTSGEDNHYAVNNLTAIDQATDTCTNNFCTLSPLADSTSILSDGNCVNNADGSQTTSKGSIAVSNGRWYTECKITTSSQYPMLGIWSVETAAFQNPTNTSYPGQVTPSYGGYGNGSIYANGSNTGSQSYTWGNGNIIGIYLDLESATKTIKWYKDGSSIATLNLATTTDAFVFGDYNSANSLTASWNFGNPVFAISSGNTDANGYGNFEFSPTIGGVDYFAICTKNLSEYG